MKISEAKYKDLYLGRLCRMATGRLAVISALRLEIPPSNYEEGAPLQQLGPRFSEIDFYILETRRSCILCFIDSLDTVELLDGSLTTKELYDLTREAQ